MSRAEPMNEVRRGMTYLRSRSDFTPAQRRRVQHKKNAARARAEREALR